MQPHPRVKKKITSCFAMSIVFIKSHNESIYDAVEKEVQIKEKKARYVSKYHKKVEADSKRKKDSHRTFGYAEVPLKTPSEFLKKSTSAPAADVACKRAKTGKRRCCKLTCLPPVPRRLAPCRSAPCKTAPDKMAPADATHDKMALGNVTQDKMAPDDMVPDRMAADKMATDKMAPEKMAPDGQPSTINFIRRNVLSVRRSAPPQRCKRVAYTRHGDTQCVMPRYVYKKTYGMTPQYLLRGMTLAEQQHQEETRRDEDQGRPAVRLMTEEEQQSLLKGLRHNWEELQRTFQLLPILTDTLPKRRRKARLEEELKKLEHNIRTVERHPFIYVYENEL